MEERPPLEGYRYRKTIGAVIAVVVFIVIAVMVYQWHNTAKQVVPDQTTTQS